MGLFNNNRSEGKYVKSYSIPSSCKDEKAHFDTSERAQGKTEDKPRPEHKPKPKAEVKPQPQPKVEVKPRPKANPKPEQEYVPPRPRPSQGLPPKGKTPSITPLGKGGPKLGKVGCAVIFLIYLGVKSCVNAITNSFNDYSNDDVEVIYDTTRYDYPQAEDDDADEYIMQEEAIDSIEYDTIFE